MGIASLVLGIIAILLAVITGAILGWLAIILGIVGIILGVIAKKNPEDKFAKPGLICSIVGTVLSVVVYIACIACLSAAGTGLSSIPLDIFAILF